MLEALRNANGLAQQLGLALKRYAEAVQRLAAFYEEHSGQHNQGDEIVVG